MPLGVQGEHYALSPNWAKHIMNLSLQLTFTIFSLSVKIKKTSDRRSDMFNINQHFLSTEQLSNSTLSRGEAISLSPLKIPTAKQGETFESMVCDQLQSENCDILNTQVPSSQNVSHPYFTVCVFRIIYFNSLI